MVTLNPSKTQQQLIPDHAIPHPEVQRTLVAAQGTELSLKELDLALSIKHLKVETGGTTNNTVRKNVGELIAELEKARE